jgi:hypothetical protein
MGLKGSDSKSQPGLPCVMKQQSTAGHGSLEEVVLAQDCSNMN